MSQFSSVLIEEWLAPLAELVGPVYPWLNGLHILSIAMLGAIALLDLRLLGVFRRVAVSQLAVPSTRLAACGLAGAVLTGFLLFSVQPAHYLDNSAFLSKLSIVAVGLVNVAVLSLSPGWRLALNDQPISAGVRAGAGISLGAWIAAIFAGRWIAFL